MKRKTNLKIAAAGTGIAIVLGGAGIAVANPSNSKSTNPFSRVLSALVGKGTITQNQADAINQALTSDRSAQQAIRTADQTAIENVVATTLGIDAATIKSRMAAGETLAAIAGTKTDALIAALVKYETSAIDAKVSAGTLTAAQATAEKANLQTLVTSQVNSSRGLLGGRPSIGGGMGGGMRGGHGGRMGGGMMGVPPQHQATVAKVLGLDWSAIQTRLAAGETLAKIAGTKTDALIAALVAEENSEIDARVTAGQMTAADATAAKAATQARETAIVNGTAPTGRGMGMGSQGFGGPGQSGFGQGGFGGGRGHRGGGFGGPNGDNGSGANGGLTNNATTGGTTATQSSLKA